MLQEKRKARKGRYKDKQGFTWRPFNPQVRLLMHMRLYRLQSGQNYMSLQDEELPVPRAPHVSHQVTPQPAALMAM